MIATTYLMKRRDLRLKIEPRSKARPRSFMGQVRPYMPKEYKAWMKDCRAQLAEQWVDEPLDYIHWMGVTFYGPRRGDLDNLLGGLLDAGNELVWADDRVSHENTTTGEVCLAVYAGNHRGWVVDREPNVASFDPRLAVEVGE